MAGALVGATAEDEVRTLIDDWVTAFCAKDIDGIMSCYAPDVLAFDAIMELQFKGAEAYRRQFETGFTYMPGPILFEVHGLNVTARDDVAFGHYLARCGCGGTDANGEEKAGWLRVTVGCRRTDGRWRIVHEHCSSPFDPQSGRVLNLQPQHAAPPL